MCSLAATAAAAIVLCVPKRNWVCNDGFGSIRPNRKGNGSFFHSAAHKNQRMNFVHVRNRVWAGLVVCVCVFESFDFDYCAERKRIEYRFRTIPKLFKLNRLEGHSAYVRIWSIDRFHWRLDTVNVPQEVCQM